MNHWHFIKVIANRSKAPSCVPKSDNMSGHLGMHSKLNGIIVILNSVVQQNSGKRLAVRCVEIDCHFMQNCSFEFCWSMAGVTGEERCCVKSPP